jgi:hypothetical protein
MIWPAAAVWVAAILLIGGADLVRDDPQCRWARGCASCGWLAPRHDEVIMVRGIELKSQRHNLLRRQRPK